MPKAKLTEDEKEAQRREIANLRMIADSMGLEVHHATKADKLKTMIADKEQQNYHEAQLVANKAKEQQAKAEATVSKLIDARQEADRLKSEDELVSYIQSYINKGVTIQFNDDDTWMMSYNRKQDSGHMTVSRKAITTAAERIMHGRSPVGSLNGDGNLMISGNGGF